MSAVALNNRVTTYSDSDAAFASCTALSIHQTTLNCEEMAGIDGLCHYEQEEESSSIPPPPSPALIRFYIRRAHRRMHRSAQDPVVHTSYSVL